VIRPGDPVQDEPPGLDQYRDLDGEIRTLTEMQERVRGRLRRQATQWLRRAKPAQLAHALGVEEGMVEEAILAILAERADGGPE
jgi:hypothetical protein